MSFDRDPTMITYSVKCKTCYKTLSYQDCGTDGVMKNFTRRVVYLIPDIQTTNGMSFLGAWLPDLTYKDEAETQIESFELAVIIKSPIAGPSRMAVSRRNKNCPEGHHLYVMSEGVAKEFLEYVPEGAAVEIDVLPEDAEDKALDARDSDVAISRYF